MTFLNFIINDDYRLWSIAISSFESLAYQLCESVSVWLDVRAGTYVFICCACMHALSLYNVIMVSACTLGLSKPLRNRQSNLVGC